MQAPFDTLAKVLIDGLLSPECSVNIDAEITAEPLYADVVVDPPADVSSLASKGMLGKIAIEPCVIEVFSDTPSLRDVDRCLARASLLRAESGRDRALWVISPGVAESFIEGWRLRRSRTGVRGVYRSAVERAPRLVVVSELPRTRATLALRLMGRRATLIEALEDVRLLDDDAWERSLILRALLRVRDDLSRMTGTDANLTEETMRYQEVAAWADQKIAAIEAAAESRGEARGEARGERSALLTLLRARGIALSPAHETLVNNCVDHERLRAWLVRAANASSAAAVFDAV